MSGPGALQADPSAIGGVAKAPAVLMPDPRRLFAQRATRFEGLAQDSPLAAYLRFLGALTHLQAELATTGPDPEPMSPAAFDLAVANGMPPLDRAALADRAEILPTLDRLFDGAAAIPMPQAAATALQAVQRATPEERGVMVANVLADAIPVDAMAQHLYVAAGLQVCAARLAVTLDPARLRPLGTGVCPACGGPPVTSLVVGVMGAEGARYAACSLCSLLWNEVRVKCLACGSTKGIGYRAVETGGEEATVKAEVCDECRSWVKILYQNKNPSLDAVADDVASLGLDILVREAGYRHAGFNPVMLGY